MTTSPGHYESVRDEIVGWLRSQVGARVPTGPIPDTAEVFGRAGMIDSLALLDLLVMLEGRFGIRLDGWIWGGAANDYGCADYSGSEYKYGRE